MPYALANCKGCGCERTREGRRTHVFCPDCRDHLKQAKQRAPRDLTRCHEMAALYRAGNTLQEIGERHGITRERVRQLIKAVGVTRQQGGLHLHAVTREEHRRAATKARKDSRAIGKFGCDFDTAKRLNGGEYLNKRGTPAQRYFCQKHSAQCRDVPWLLTFPQWLEIWESSGHFHERGKGRDGYCMARKNDAGPYSVGNVYITTCAGNVRDYQAELKRRGVRCEDGYRRLPETVRRLARRKHK